MWGKLSILSYLASLTNLLMMLFRFNPFNWSKLAIFFYGVFLLGILGLIFSILSNFFDPSKKDRTNKIQTFIFYIGMIIVFCGVLALVMHWPHTVVLFAIGLIIMAGSFFMKMGKGSGDDELLDS